MISRRSLLMSSSAALAGTFASPLYASNSLIGLDPAKPEDLHLIHRKLAYTYDDRPVFWFIDATRYGHVNHEFTPFWRMLVCMVYKVVSTGEFSFDMHFGSVIYYVDLKTGELIDEFNNPYTGEIIPVRQPGFNKGFRQNDLHGVLAPPSNLKDYKRVYHKGQYGPASIVGDDVWCRSDVIYRYEPIISSDQQPTVGNDQKSNNKSGSAIQVNDWITLHGSISEVANKYVPSANATFVFNDINTFRRWVGMGRTPGNYVSRGFGRKAWSLDAMPYEIQKLILDKHPELAENPTKAIMS